MASKRRFSVAFGAGDDVQLDTTADGGTTVTIKLHEKAVGGPCRFSAVMKSSGVLRVTPHGLPTIVAADAEASSGSDDDDDVQTVVCEDETDGEEDENVINLNPQPGKFVLVSYDKQSAGDGTEFVEGDGDDEYEPLEEERVGVFWVQEVGDDDTDPIKGYWLKERAEFTPAQQAVLGPKFKCGFTDEYTSAPAADYEGPTRWDKSGLHVVWTSERNTEETFPGKQQPRAHVHVLDKSEGEKRVVTWPMMRQIAKAQLAVFSQPKQNDSPRDAGIRAATPLKSAAAMLKLYDAHF